MVNNNSGNIDSEKVVDLNNLKTYLKEFYDGTIDCDEEDILEQNE